MQNLASGHQNLLTPTGRGELHSIVLNDSLRHNLRRGNGKFGPHIQTNASIVMDLLRHSVLPRRPRRPTEKAMKANGIAGTAEAIGAPARRRRIVMRSVVILLAGFVMTNVSRAEQVTPSTSSDGQSQASTNQQGHSQSNTGSIDTHSGGAPAANPQGDTPPGMQPVPAEPKKE